MFEEACLLLPHVTHGILCNRREQIDYVFDGGEVRVFCSSGVHLMNKISHEIREMEKVGEFNDCKNGLYFLWKKNIISGKSWAITNLKKM